MTWNNPIHQQITGQQRQFAGLSEQHILCFWQWLATSCQEHAGASSRSLHNQTGKWSREENQPCHPLQGPFWVLGTRESPWGSSEEHETAFTTHLFWDGWRMILHVYPFPSSAGRKQSKAWGRSHRRWWLRVWRQILPLPVSFRTWAFPVKPGVKPTME